jgi:hypothetical protein
MARDEKYTFVYLPFLDELYVFVCLDKLAIEQLYGLVAAYPVAGKDLIDILINRFDDFRKMKNISMQTLLKKPSCYQV